MWQSPSDPLPGMPAYPGSLNMNRGHEGQPVQTRPGLEENKKSSSNMILAAAGGFAAGGVAGYFVKDRIGKC